MGRGEEMRETEWERQGVDEEGGREGPGCCILVIAQTETAGADRGKKNIDEKLRN